jgi:hypothetical protein
MVILDDISKRYAKRLTGKEIAKRLTGKEIAKRINKIIK